jgi:leucine dehydrogenase
MNVFEQTDADGFEQVVFCHDRATGLRAIIAVHNTVLGPSLGGCRFFPYADEAAALTDALGLAQAMTYKASLAGLDLGGGKAVIWGDPEKDKTDALLSAYAERVDRLRGTYITTVDSGTHPSDMDRIRKSTKHVVGMSPANGGSGDPSPSTARGVAEGMKACAEAAFGSDDLSGRRIALQGVGAVGFPLARILSGWGAKLIVADKNRANLERAVREFKAEAVDVDAVFGVACDILAPCAMGRAIHETTLPKLRCKVVAGAANNQLASPGIADELHRRGILYAPDYAINAGGLIHVSAEYGVFEPGAVETKVRAIRGTIASILARSSRENRSPALVALDMARERVRA